MKILHTYALKYKFVFNIIYSLHSDNNTSALLTALMKNFNNFWVKILATILYNKTDY